MVVLIGNIATSAPNWGWGLGLSLAMTSATRYVEMVLNKGATLENYYWMEGPLPLDQGIRVILSHYN